MYDKNSTCSNYVIFSNITIYKNYIFIKTYTIDSKENQNLI